MVHSVGDGVVLVLAGTNIGGLLVLLWRDLNGIWM